MSQPTNRRASLAICFFLALAVWVVFGRTLHYDFINYDDDRTVYDNPAITRGISGDSVAWAFTHFHNDNWHPLTTLSHMLDCQFYGVHPGGHHLTNVIIHGATVILLFLMLRSMTGEIWRSAFVAAVFAIHPLRVESVAWVSERKDVLSGLFFVLTLWAYACYARKPEARGQNAWSFAGSRFYWLALLFFALGLLSKPMLVTLPFILLLLDFWPLGRLSSGGTDGSPGIRSWLRLWPEKIPFLALAAGSCFATILAQRHATVSFEGVSFPARTANALMAYTTYLWQMIFPFKLAPFYPHPGNHPPADLAVACGLALLIISTGVILGMRKHPYLLTGWLWYLGMLVPVIGLVQVGGQAHADRYTYLPQIGLYLMVAWGAVELCGRWPWHRVALGSAAAVILALLISQARLQTGYWQNSISLWTHSLACAPENPLAQNDLGAALASKEKFADAIQHYERALALKPNYADAQNNLGFALVRLGRPGEAAKYFEQSLQLKPDNAQALYNLGNMMADAGKLPEAVRYYEDAIRLRPDYIEALYNLANVLVGQGKLAEAAQRYQRVLQLKPDHADAWNNLGNALARQGRWTEAVDSYQRANQLNPASIETLFNLGETLASHGRLDEGIQRMQQALDLAHAQKRMDLVGTISGRLKSYQAKAKN